MKRVLVVTLVLCLLLTACVYSDEQPSGSGTTPQQTVNSAPSDPPADHKIEDGLWNALNFYVEYMQTSMVNAKHATNLYCYYKNEADRELALTGDSLVLTYRIIRCEALSDRLWEVEWCITSEMFRDEVYGAHHVGWYDGRLWVFRGIDDIPDSLTEGITIEPYKPHGPGWLGPGDVLG